MSPLVFTLTLKQNKVAHLDCTWTPEQLQNPDGIEVDTLETANAAVALVFLAMAFIEHECPCSRCLKEGTELSTKEAIAAVEELLKVGFPKIERIPEKLN